MEAKDHPPLLCRRIVLHNCGRFVHMSADFGSEYTTHVHLSSEMLYAGLTREQSRKPRAFAAAMGGYRFSDDFDVRQIPLWFTVGMAPDGKVRRDRHTFNSLLEAQPGVHKNDKLPKFGAMETVLPDQPFETYALSPDPAQLAHFARDQVFWMGKKRTMFQITDVGEVADGRWEAGPCRTPAIQIVPEDVQHFDQMEVIAATQRCLVVRGHVSSAQHVRFDQGMGIGVPAFALMPLLMAVGG